MIRTKALIRWFLVGSALLMILLLTTQKPATAAPYPTSYNGHYYERVPGPDPWGYMAWADARDAAAARTYNGCPGHLVTVNAAGEWDFLVTNGIVQEADWLGGYSSDGVSWQWVTGEPWQYAAWAPSQPDPYEAIRTTSSLLWEARPSTWQAIAGYVVEYEPCNEPPTASAGGTYAFNEGSSITLDGSSSTDPDGDPLTYSWSVNSTSCYIAEPTFVTPTLTCADNGSYSVTLSINDGQATDSDTTSVTVYSVAPTVESIFLPTEPVAIADQPVSAYATFSDPAFLVDHPYSCTVDYGDGSGAQAGVYLLGSSPTCTGPDHSYAEVGEYQVTFTVTDNDGATGSATSSDFIVIYDPTPPVITPSVSGTLGNNDWYTDDVTIVWTVSDPESAVSSSGCDTVVINTNTAGTTLTCTASSAGGTASASVTIMRDATPPTTSASPSPAANANGWNNTDVSVSFTGTDNLSGITSCSADVVLTAEGVGQSASGTCTDLAGNVSSPASVAGINIDKTAPIPTHSGPFRVDEGSSVLLDGTASTDALSGMASTAWALDGDNLYDDGDPALFNGIDDSVNPLSLKVVDLAGNEGVADTQVTVNNVNPAIDSLSGPVEPVNINDQSPVSVSVAFSDPGTLDTHDVTWSWGDGSSDVQAGAISPATQSHSYSAPGVYPVTVTVTDDDGGTVSQDYEYIVIYDPDGGFVTGGGWIDSPAGAYVADPLLTGKASFGFVSKYKKGANVPTGQTQFQFKAGNLNFHSSSYEWLVVTGAGQAKYKGVGTINGSGNYGFMLTATDNGNSGDTFRIKIWDIDNGDAVVYDNQLGADDDSYDGTVIGGGNIKVHAK